MNTTWGRLQASMALAVVGLVGCSTGSKSLDDGATQSSSGAAQQAELQQSAAAEEVATRLRVRFQVGLHADDEVQPVLAPVIAHGGAKKFLVKGSFLEADVPAPSRRSTAIAAKVALPRRAQGAFTLSEAPSGLRIEVALEGAADIEGQLADGVVVYPDAMRGVFGSGSHVLHRVTVQGTEDFISIERAPAEPSVRYTVVLNDKVAGLRLVENVLEFMDPTGDPRLRMAAPYLIDAQGERHDAKVALSGCRFDANPADPWERPPVAPGARSCTVHVRWDIAGSRYPVLLDPGWTTTGSMTTARTEHTATLVRTSAGSHRVLVTGGASGSTELSSAELYNPAAGTWAATGSMSATRIEHTATATTEPPANGTQVLVVAGYSGLIHLQSAERYSMTSGTFASASALTTPRTRHGASLFAGTGRILVSGGYNSGSSALSSMEMWDPSNNTWSAAGTMTSGRQGHISIGHSTLNFIMLAGGRYNSTSNRLTSETWQHLTSAQDTVSQFGTTRNMLAGHFQAAAINYSTNYVLVVGDSATAESATFSGGWTARAAAPVSIARGNGLAMFVTDESVLTTSGSSSYVYDLFTNTWFSAGPLDATRTGGSLTYISSYARTLAAGGGTSGVPSAEYFAELAQGVACADAGECDSRYCVDGVCCNSACTSFCNACSAAKKSQGSNGVCGAIRTGYDPDLECPDDGAGSCDRDGYCDGAGACRIYSSGTMCATASCSVTTLTSHLCNGSGSCQDNVSQCDPYVCAGSTACRTNCTLDSHCLATHYCASNTCVLKKSQGSTCTAGTQCATGFCVDGFCCNEQCSGLCKGCSAAVKGPGGGVDGECGFVIAGRDTQTECAQDPQTSCQNDGYCSGTGTCRLWNNVPCGATWCDGNVQKGQKCDGLGTCTNDATTGTDCNPYLCVGTTCTNPCVSDTNCVLNHFCDAGTCRPKMATGQTCTASTQCVSGYCIDGVCCNTACSGLCYACSAARKHVGVNGDCGQIAAGYDDDNDCAVGTECKEDGYCNGTGACRLQASGTPCGGSVCVGNSVTSQVCNGTGSCINDTSGTVCTPYTCSSGACADPCAIDSHCVTGYFCDAGACAAKFPAGTLCTAANQCLSGSCTDGVCCNLPCSGVCQACSASRKGVGIDGECGAIVAGSDPDDECAVQASCGQDGTCNGASACRLKVAGTSCGTTQCVGNTVTGQVCDGSGLCTNDPTGTDCTPHICSGGACANPCLNDTQCVSGYFCDAGTCSAEKANGTACSAGAECSSGNCVDGMCCNSACSGLCQACSAAAKGTGVDGDCGPVLSGQDPGDECSVEAGCGQNGSCNGNGACALKAAGTSCGASQCVGNVVTGLVCDGLGLCVNDAVGTNCTPHLCSGGACSDPCVSDSNCVVGYYCASGACVAKGVIGAACTATNQCQTGFCVDSVCCDAACSGLCRACSTARKGTGANGECGAIQAGGDPDGECSVESACGQDGTCDGVGACRLKLAGVSCGSTQCVGNSVTGQVCDGVGLCVNDATGTNCSPHLCTGGACANPCVSDTNCIAAYYCDAGTCRAKLSNGQACTAGNACTSGFCVDGVCCNNACSAQCAACSAAKKGAGSNGDCGPVVNGVDPDGECAPESGCGQNGYCNGSGACALKVAGTSCGATQCVGNAVTGQVCDGVGLCINDAVGTSCTPHLCSGGACVDPCLSDAHCVTGYYCDGGTCAAKGPIGTACTGANQCLSGFCVDGTCCNTTCSGLCYACSAAKKGVGANGDCGPIQGGADPDTECSLEASCGQDGTCNGLGACRLKLAGVACGATQCVGNSATGQVCDGVGLCINDTVGTDCGLHLCTGGACANPCLSDAHCINGHYCDGGTCRPKESNGDACTSDNACTSGYCVDDVCCDGACSNACYACSATKKGTGLDGECGPIKSGSDPDAECSEQAGCGQDGMCNGAGVCRLKQAGASCGATQCVGNSATGQVCDGQGLCVNDAIGTNCSPHVCTGGSCAVPCVGDVHCVSGYFCDEGTCRERQVLGEACSSHAACLSGNCIDDVCCDTLCSGLCQACSEARKGMGIDGECGSVIQGGDPDEECAEQSGCGLSGACSGVGACDYWAANKPCGATQCENNAVTGRICNGSGACVTDSIGTDCSPQLCSGGSCISPCLSDTHCINGYWCDAGTCVAKLTLGEACTAANQCVSTFCTDGVCCDKLCSSPCSACEQSLKENGQSGECGPAKAGFDPHNDCPDDGALTCQRDGACDGNSACRLYPAGEPCGPTQCNGNLVKGKLCTGNGACVLDSNGLPCAPYMCESGACADSCQSTSDCLGDYWCSDFLCESLGLNGQACTKPEGCLSGFCADGVCCESECKGQCEACNQSGDGTCAAVMGPPVAPYHPDCHAASLDCSGSCDGSNRQTCTYPGPQSLCGSSGCTGNVLTVSRCDSNGACEPDQAKDCGAYACDPSVPDCRATCESNADCASGAECDLTKSECGFSSATCQDAFHVQESDGTVTSCEPYECVAGACKESCETTANCASGYACQGQKCIKVAQPGNDGGVDPDGGAAPSTTAEQASGCGCRMPVSTSTNTGWGVLAALGALAALRRRRRA